MIEINDPAVVAEQEGVTVTALGGSGLAGVVGSCTGSALNSSLPRRSRSVVPVARRQSCGAAAAPLRQTMRQLQRALHRAEQERLAAVQAFERQAAFMTVLAHELRAPLSPIRNAGVLLGRACSREMNAFVSELLERQTSHASRLVEDLLDVSRIRTGRLRLQRAVVDLSQVLTRAVQTCQPGMDSREQSLIVDAPPRPLWVDGDVVRLTQILNNLLGNASRYTPQGGEIVLAVHTEPERVTVIVKDSGIGIAEKDLRRIFDAYFQEEIAAGCDAIGLGLGLSVVRDLVLAHGGRIDARSDGPGCGSRFEMSLALLPRNVPVPAAAQD